VPKAQRWAGVCHGAEAQPTDSGKSGSARQIISVGASTARVRPSTMFEIFNGASGPMTMCKPSTGGPFWILRAFISRKKSSAKSRRSRWDCTVNPVFASNSR
jgi:hypothetical protein